jgi:DNA-binding protein HU-beta
MKPQRITFFTTLRKERNTMNQSELTLKTAQVSGLSRKDVERVLKTAGDVIGAALVEEGEAVLPGLGKLTIETRAARTGRNPKTGEALQIPAKKVARFSASKALKDAVAA